jgi:hypothetical protein
VQPTAPAAAPTPEAESSTEVAAVQTTQPAQTARPRAVPRSIPVTPPPAQQPEPEPKKKGFFGRLRDIFK